MQNYPNQLRLKVRGGEYDEPFEKLFNVALVLAVPGFFTAYCVIFQLGCFEYFSNALKPAHGIEWPVFPN
jgi:hypothetical protein